MCAEMGERGPGESHLVFPLGCRGVFWGTNLVS